MQSRRWNDIIPNIVAVDTGCLLLESIDIAVVVGGAFVWDAASGALADLAADHFSRALISWTETPVECVVFDDAKSYDSLLSNLRQRVRFETALSPRRAIAECMMHVLETSASYPMSCKRVVWRLPSDAQERMSIEQRTQMMRQRAMRWASAISGSMVQAARPASVHEIVSAMYMLADPVRATRIAPPIHALPPEALNDRRTRSQRLMSTSRPKGLGHEGGERTGDRKGAANAS